VTFSPQANYTDRATAAASVVPNLPAEDVVLAQQPCSFLIPSFHPLLFSWVLYRSPLWSSGQSSWMQIQRYRVGFPALPDFLSSSGSGTEPARPREDK
jgi:hypothetical protein